MSAVVLVPLLVTVLTVGVIVVSTVVTVRAERRYNAVLAVRWIETQRRRMPTRQAGQRIAHAHSVAIRSARAQAKRDAA